MNEESNTGKPQEYIVTLETGADGMHTTAKVIILPDLDLWDITPERAKENILKALQEHVDYDPEVPVRYIDLDADGKKAISDEIRSGAHLVELDGTFYIANPYHGLLVAAPRGEHTDVQACLDTVLPVWLEEWQRNKKLSVQPEKVRDVRIKGDVYEITTKYVQTTSTVGAWKAYAAGGYEAYGVSPEHAVFNVTNLITAALEADEYVPRKITTTKHTWFVRFDATCSLYEVRIPELNMLTVRAMSLEDAVQRAQLEIQEVVNGICAVENKYKHSGWTQIYPECLYWKAVTPAGKTHLSDSRQSAWEAVVGHE